MNLPIRAIVVVLVVLALAGGAIWMQRSASLPKTVSLSKTDMEVLLGTLPASALEDLSNDPAAKKNMISKLKEMLALGQAAEAAGYADRADLKPMVEYSEVNSLGSIYREKNPDAKVTQQDIESYNQQHSKEFDQLLATTPGGLQAEASQKEQMRARFATMHIYAERAQKAGLGKDRATELEVMLGRYQLLASAYAKDLQDSDKLVTDQDVQNYFNQHSSDFDQVRARHILIGTKDQSKPDEEGGAAAADNKKGLTVDEARAKAQSILDRIKKGEDFAKLAEEYSDDPGSKQRGGDLGYFPHGKMVPAFDQAAFALKPGEVSGLVQSQFGFHIIKCEDRKKGSLSDPSVRAEIMKVLVPEKFDEKVNNIITHSKVKIAEDFTIPSKPANPAPGAGAPAPR